MVWANSSAAESYFHLWEMKAGFVLGDFEFKKSLHHWINDGLMAIFFFVVGLEIKREILVGELSSFRKASLPLVAAVGGVLLPALIYFGFNAGKPGVHGWGVPMATDIAFALGILALLGKRVPIGLKVFLTALAIVDDIIAVLVIAVFYTANLKAGYLGMALIPVFAMAILNRSGIRAIWMYAGLSLILWFLVLQSGVHATVAGIVAAMLIPARPRIEASQFTQRAKELIATFEKDEVESTAHALPSEHIAVQELSTRVKEVDTLLNRLMRGFHPWVAFFIMPVFALSNAGVSLAGIDAAGAANPVTLGVAAGLIAGKFFGILGFAWLAVKIGLGSLPRFVRWPHVAGASMLGGIGFTMAFFIATLAFESDATLLNDAKIGILAGSTVAAIVGLLLLAKVTRGPAKEMENAQAASM